MGHIESGEAFVAALNAQQWETVAGYLTDDFTWVGGAAGPTGKDDYIAVQKAWFAAAPDYHATLSNIRDEGDTGYGTVTASGTLTNPLALPGLPALPATGKHFSATFESTVTWRGDQVARMVLEPVGPTVLEQLGVQLPQ